MKNPYTLWNNVVDATTNSILQHIEEKGYNLTAIQKTLQLYNQDTP